MAIFCVHWQSAEGCASHFCGFAGKSARVPASAFTSGQDATKTAWASRGAQAHGSTFCLGLLLLVLAILCAAGATPKRVLIPDSYGRDVAPFNASGSAFRTTLASELGEPVDLHEVSLEMGRFADPAMDKPFVDFLEHRQPTVWALHRWRIIAILSLCLVEAVLIALLVMNLVKRRRAEEAARDLSGRLINAQEEERARLARELHDDITQRLARLAIDVGRCELGTSEVSLAETTREVREGLAQLSEDVHALSYRLHPSILEDLGLAAALRAEGERFTRRESLPVEVKLHEIQEPMPRDTALCLFRVAQEALRNVARHAHARRVEVSLRGLEGGLQLAVRDDGCGFDPALQRDRPSLGLASMRERVHLLGGELDIDSAPGHGTTIVAWVPLKERPL
jgi:signal transduction histidine kinase